MQSFGHIFLIGIKGAGMANIAVIIKKMGGHVSGSDTDDVFITDKLLANNSIHWSKGFDQKNLPHDTRLVVYSAAHGGRNNPQVIEAKKRGVKTMHQAEFLNIVMRRCKTKIAVAGCHGKTTTSALLAEALIKLGEKPSYFIGAPFFGEYKGSDYQQEKYFVIEADEYGINPPEDKTPKFLSLEPDIVLCTNIDFDHPDVYDSLEETKKAYIRFFDSRQLILCADDTVLRSLVPNLRKNSITTYGFDEHADLVITNNKTNENGSQFRLQYKGMDIGEFSINLFGKKNILNAAGVILTLIQLGFKPLDIRESVANFVGAARRFNLVYKAGSMFLIDDYAHHPSEIKATIEAARDRFPARRIVTIFQPHTYSRTSALLHEFVDALSIADQSFVLPIFPSARENPNNFPVSSEMIEKKAIEKGKKNVVSVLTVNELTEKLHGYLHKTDVILTMGAGNVYELKKDIINVIDMKSI